MKIKDIIGRSILDSRGNPTVEVDVVLDSGVIGRASVPSGASRGTKEALELRDNNDKYNGLGVEKAVYNVNHIIRDNLIGMDVRNQHDIDYKMIELDGSENKSNIGANAILGVSMAVLKAASLYNKKYLYQYIGNGKTLPIPMINILNGGVHADNNLDFQEFMIIPNRDTMKERIRISSEVFHSLKKVLKINGYNTNVGDEGGFAPNLNNNSVAIELIIEAIKDAGYEPGIDINLGIDVAANEIYKDGFYYIDGKKLTTNELIKYYQNLIDLYPIISIEDPVFEDDWEGLIKITKLLDKKIQIVGDDIFVTNKKYLKMGIDKNAGNAILIKLNQIGTITEAQETINLAKSNGYKTIISHRSGETEDTTIADLAVGLNIGWIKTGSMSRTDRICKYNELMRIEEKINNGKI